MILYFSGTGNSKYVALRLGELLGDDVYSINEALKRKEWGKFVVSDRIILVCPTYAWRIPMIVTDWIEKSSFCGVKNMFFVMTCGDSIHNAGYYNRKLCKKKGFNYMGTAHLVMPENYIAMFNAPALDKAEKIVDIADKRINRFAEVIKKGETLEVGKKRATMTDWFMSGPVNQLFYLFKIKASPFRVTDACVSCGRCAKVCPLNNISMGTNRASAQGKSVPHWGSKCTHCMACICFCPKEAIEYGNISKGKVRYNILKIRTLEK